MTELCWDPEEPREAVEFLAQGNYLFWQEGALVVISALDFMPSSVKSLGGILTQDRMVNLDSATQPTMIVEPGRWIEFDGRTFGWGRRGKG